MSVLNSVTATVDETRYFVTENGRVVKHDYPRRYTPNTLALAIKRTDKPMRDKVSARRQARKRSKLSRRNNRH